MQAFHCVFGLGTFAAPWLAASFISQDIEMNNSTSSEAGTEAPLEFLTTEGTMAPKHEKSRVHFTYLIVGAYSIVAAGFFVITYVSHRKYGQNHPEIQGNKNKGIRSEKSSEAKQKEPKWFIIPVLILMFFRFAFYVGLDIMSASHLMTFAVKGLGWTKPQGVAVTSCLRGLFSAGRFASVLLAFFMSPTKMICF